MGNRKKVSLKFIWCWCLPASYSHIFPSPTFSLPLNLRFSVSIPPPLRSLVPSTPHPLATFSSGDKRDAQSAILAHLAPFFVLVAFQGIDYLTPGQPYWFTWRLVCSPFPPSPFVSFPFSSLLSLFFSLLSSLISIKAVATQFPPSPPHMHWWTFFLDWWH